MSSVEKVVKAYRQLSDIPALINAKFLKKESIIESLWSQRNLEQGKSIKFQKTFVVDENWTKISELRPLDVTNELLTATSPSEKLRAVLREVDGRQYLEIWHNNNLGPAVDLAALDIHGNVYTDSEFGTFQWSPDETKLLYLAELKPPKTEPFHKRFSKKESDEKITKGEENLFVQDWGEQLVGKKKPVIAQYNLQTDCVEIFNGIPENVCPAQVIYSEDQSCLIGVAYKTEPRKLGLIYCSNRLGTIFKLDFNGNYWEIPLKNKAVKSPRITPDGKTLVWLQREAGGPHAGAFALMKTNLPLTENSEPTIVLDIVRTEIQIENGMIFHGLYNYSLPKRCFASGNRLILSTNQRNSINIYIIEIDSGKIFGTKVYDGSQIILDVCNDCLLINRRNFLKPDQLVVQKLGETTIHELTTSQSVPLLRESTYEYLDLTQNTDETCRSFSAIYLGPKEASNTVKLIVWPHGGPHSAFANNLSLEASLFLSMGFAVLLVNYRGSIGAGQDSVDFLPGKIGKADVADCLLAVEVALKKFTCLNSNKMVLVGGSHGGFLVAHLSGQFPDLFQAVIARNPVIDVASMSIVSDIPDWCYVEGGRNYSQTGEIDNSILMAMRKASPIEFAHKVKAPTLLQIGSKDLRVPPHQGFEYYTRLKANGVVCRMNLYDDNHPLGTVPNEMDNLINTVLWIEKYCQ